MYIYKADESYYLFESAHKNICVGFTTRAGGVSKGSYASLNLGLHTDDNKKNVITNREILARKLKIQPQNSVFMNQTHSSNIEYISAKDTPSDFGFYDDNRALKNTDAVFTDNKNLMLCVMTADCCPVLFYDPNSKIIGSAHCGWRGTVSGIIPALIKKCSAQNKLFSTENLMVFIGPHICGECYEVSNDFKINVKDNFSEYSNFIFEKENNKFVFNIKKAILNDLFILGVNKKNIIDANICSLENNNDFFSYRANNNTGRTLSFITTQKKWGRF